MNPGDSINGYTLTSKFTTTGGGQCKWAFARRGEREFFIKQFLAPTYPLPGAPGSDKIKAEKRLKCERFEAHHKLIKDKLAPLSSTGGNLVVTEEFFRHGAHYFKVTARVKTDTERVADIVALPLDERIRLMIAVTRSLDILHRNGLVHGDIKPPNILIERRPDGIGAKLIDFDNCFVAGDPPPVTELVGDLAHYAPEMVDVIVGEMKPEHLSVKVDIFSLGLTFAQYLTGGLPSFSNDQRYAAEVLRQGGRLAVAASGDAAPLATLVQSMLEKDPTARPDCAAIFEQLKRIRRGGPVEEVSGSISTPTAAPAASPTPGTPRGKLLERAASAPGSPTAAGTSASPAGPTVPPKPRGKLFERAASSSSPASPTPAEPPTPPKPRGKLFDKLARPASGERTDDDG